VITISEGLKSFFEEYNSNVIVLRNGMSNLIEKKPTNIVLEKFTISYTGTLYSGRRDPSMMFSVLEKLVTKNKIKLSDLDLVYAGKEGNLWEELADNYNLKSVVTNLGMLPIQEAVSLQTNTHINLLLTWCTPEQKGILTGKFFEYLNARKAIILYISGIKDVEFEAIMSQLNIGVVAYEDDTLSLEKFILSKYEEWKETKKVVTTIDEDKLKEFSWDHQFKAFYNQIDF
jgi:glycosyltransferase involved in cell wall biosynthesis